MASDETKMVVQNDLLTTINSGTKALAKQQYNMIV